MNTYRQAASSVVRDVLKSGDRLTVTITGDSMLPALRSGERVSVETVDFSKIRRGDVVLYDSEGELIAHRVIHLDADICHLRGDWATRIEKIPADQLRGRVICVKRNGNNLPVGGWMWRYSGLLRNYLYQARRKIATILGSAGSQ